MARTLALILAAAVLSGCTGTTLLVNRHSNGAAPAGPAAPGPTGTTRTTTTPAPDSAAAKAYLRALKRGQRTLAAAERTIPTRARTPAALARSIRLLQRAIRRLGDDLEAITPPAAVASAHSRLVSTARVYALRLGAAARAALRRGGELRASNMLISATTAASAAFSTTVSQIDAALGG